MTFELYTDAVLTRDLPREPDVIEALIGASAR